MALLLMIHESRLSLSLVSLSLISLSLTLCPAFHVTQAHSSELPESNMPKPCNPYWQEHTNVIRVINTPTQAGSGTRRWQCKYCNFELTSTISRVVIHLTGIGTTGNCGGCKQVPQDIRDKLIAENSSTAKGSKKLRGSQHSQDALHDALVGEMGDSSTQDSLPTGGRKRARVMQEGDEDDDAHVLRQSTLPSRVSSLSWVKERQKVAEMEIARTLVECNISFNVLRTDQWKRMVRAIAEVGHTDSWSGVEYNKMRTMMLEEQKALIDKALVPVKAGWQSFGCTIISDGWSDMRRRHIMRKL